MRERMRASVYVLREGLERVRKSEVVRKSVYYCVEKGLKCVQKQ